MKDIHKKPVFYYILIPVLVSIWPLLIWFLYLPQTGKKWINDRAEYEQSRGIMAEILALDPDRLDFSNSTNNSDEFDYAAVVDKVANSCGISSRSYRISSKPIRTKKDQKSQSATIVLEQIDITSFAKFLSTIQLRWANLHCEKVKLKKQEGFPDSWTIDISFKYYY